MWSKFFKNTNQQIIVAFLAAVLTGYLHQPFLYTAASTISLLFINILKCISIPLIFLSLVATVGSMENFEEFKRLGKRVVKYTLLTTFIASFVALAIFLIIDPVRSGISLTEFSSDIIQQNTNGKASYLTYFINIVPSNVLSPFVENHVISVLFLAILCSLAILTLPTQHRAPLQEFFSGLYGMTMKIATWVVCLMPIGIWSFVTLFIRDMRDGMIISQLALYLCCVLLANLLQGLVILPAFLKIKRLSPIKLAKGMMPALSIAFFSKSSSATLPMAMRCAEENLGIDKKITSFAFPLCTTINMNACAAFILTTVLFVSIAEGMTFTLVDYIMWAVIATIAAVGNAGVPMGCFFLSSALLASLNVPLNLMGVILPFYALIDMLETALNVWSDSCVVAVVNKEVNEEVRELPLTPSL